MKDTLEQLDVVNSYAALPAAFYTRLPTQPLTDPQLLHANQPVAALLGLSAQAVHTAEFLQVMSGQKPLPGGDTLAAVYSGHQFGIWAGQLGDGRAHLLGEVVTPEAQWEVQLKGSGRTPYSRMGDGRAVLRSSVREYLASEAMAGLGIPTTRALSLVVSHDPVYRETVETAAVVARVSPSFVRFGSFEHWSRQPENLRILLDYVVRKHYPECMETSPGEQASEQTIALRFLHAVVERTARLVADWQTAGFCHGVMNTDNMSILGLTLDYGPYGFMDTFSADHVCNHSDTQGRYAWNAQPSVAHWNLYRLASALIHLGLDEDALKEQLRHFEPVFLDAYRGNLTRKLGLARYQEGDDSLMDDWWQLLHTQKADFHLSFRRLAGVMQDSGDFLSHFEDRRAAQAWLDSYKARVARDDVPDAQRVVRMNQVNPVYVLRNHLAEQAIRAASKGDASEIETLLALLREPCNERPGYEAYAQAPPEGTGPVEVSCSS